MKKIILTGGGTAGHVTPNLALLPSLQKEEFEIRYIGSYNGIERRLIEETGIPYDGISSGKLRRYFDIKNFSDPLRVLKGYAEALKIMKKYKPDVVFSKGGFVAVPVVLAARHHYPGRAVECRSSGWIAIYPSFCRPSRHSCNRWQPWLGNCQSGRSQYSS